MNEISIFSPATVANVGCGFDILGFALEKPGDILKIRHTKKAGIKIINNTNDFRDLPLIPEKNTAGIAAIKLLEYLKIDEGFEIELIQKVKPGSGIGSSAASSVASVFGINCLLGSPLSKKQLIPFAMEGEKLASGVAHADNVAPAMLGGFVLIRSYNPLDIIEIPYPENLFCTVVHPLIEVKTEDARKILKQTVSLKKAITQWGNTAGLIAGLMKNDFELIGRSLEDAIIEPARAILIPNFYEIKQSALNAGALGCSISGSGPSIFALSNSYETAHAIQNAMTLVINKLGISLNAYISKINQQGVKTL